MKISAKSPTAQRIGRLAAVGAVALLLAGSVAAPTDARKRSEAVKQARYYAGECQSYGGTPYTFDTGGVIFQGCAFSEHSVEVVPLEIDEDE